MLGIFKPFHVEELDWHPLCDFVLKAIEERDWEEVAALLGGESVDSAMLLLFAIGQRTKLDDPFDLLQGDPEIRLIMGAILVHWAWRHRGFGRGHEVSEENWSLCLDRARTAQSLLRSALEGGASPGLCSAYLVRAATVLSEPAALNEAERHFWQAPVKPLEGAAWLLQGWARKWLGNHEEMEKVAELAVGDQTLPPARHAVLARSVIERFLWDAYMDDDPEVNRRGRNRLASREMREKVAKIETAFRQETELLPEPADPYSERFAHNQLGALTYLTGFHLYAKRHVQALGSWPGEWPWLYFIDDDRPAAWRKLRREVMA